MKTDFWAALKTVQGIMPLRPFVFAAKTRSSACAAAELATHYGEFALCDEIDAHIDTETSETICFAGRQRVFVSAEIAAEIRAKLDSENVKLAACNVRVALTFDEAVDQLSAHGASVLMTSDGEWSMCSSDGCQMHGAPKADPNDHREFWG